MSTHKYIDKICWAAMAACLLLTVLLSRVKAAGGFSSGRMMGYENRLFDTGSVHAIDIVMEDWDGFIDTCENEEYVPCTVVVDGEVYKNVGIRAKGNTSLRNVSAMGSSRYSFKIEFDQYEQGKSYYGLDKLSLNNLIQDNTYMKDYLSYRMMAAAGAAAPLCSYAFITVNGEDWGLYLAVEGVEESFLKRNYGSQYGELYKPDSMDMGGGPGNGREFDFERFREEMPDMEEGGGTKPPEMPNMAESRGTKQPEMPEMAESGGAESSSVSDNGIAKTPGNGFGGGFNGGMGSDDVKLIYTDDSYGSYANIFGNAKTDITDADRDRLIASLRRLNAGEDIDGTVDTEKVIRYFIAHNFVCNFDSYTGAMIHNYYLYEKDGQLSMIPWDYNLAFGGFQASEDATEMVNFPVDDPVSGGDTASRPMLAWIFDHEEYTELYHQYFAEFISEYFESGYFEEEIDKTVELIAPYVEKDPTKFCTLEEFEAGSAALKAFCLLRAESVKGQLGGAIPSTAEGQRQDASALVSAGDLSIADMGTMDMGDMGDMGGGFGNHLEQRDFEKGAFDSDTKGSGEHGFSDGSRKEPYFLEGVSGEQNIPDRDFGEWGALDKSFGEQGVPDGAPGEQGFQNGAPEEMDSFNGAP